MNLIEGLQEEMERCRELIKEYEAIGSAGIFATSALKLIIKEAKHAIANGDTIRMLKLYEELKSCN